MKLKKILSSILCVAMVVGAMNFTVLSAEKNNSVSESTTVLTVGSDYSTVYYGGIPWRVLSKNYSSDSQDENAQEGILLLSEHAMANGIQYNAHYSNNAWSSADKSWASAMVMPWDDERNPHYADNIANGTKTDDSSGGYLTSDVRMYLTGIGTYETFRPFAYYNESWPGSWDTMPDRNGQGWRYYTRNIVTDTEPVDGVTYFVKDEFELSDHNRNSAKVNGITVPGLVTLTPADWAEDTWYTLDEKGKPVLMTEWPEDATTVNAYYDQAGYSIADVSNGFEDGVTYYTFKRYLENVCPKVVVAGEEIAMGEHLSGLFKWVGYAVPELDISDHNKALTETIFVAGLPASRKNFASDMEFSDIEIAAVLPTSGHGYNRGSGFNGGWSGSIGSTFADRLEDDTYFLLSGEEVYKYLTTAGHTAPATHLDGVAAGDLWTRSWGRADIQTVITYANNAVNWYKGANTWWQSIRPAFNLNPDAVAFYAPVEDVDFAAVEENTTNEYKLVLKDNSRDFSVKTISTADDVYEVAYSGAKTGDNEYVSAIVKDADDNVVAYGKVAQAQESGTITLDLSAYNMSDKKLYLFNEQCNGEKETNYASELVMVAPSLPTATVSEPVINTTVMARTYDGSLGNVSVETPLTFQMNFKADEPTDKQREYYSEWLADYELVINKDVRGIDGYLAGQYDSFFADWIKLGVDTEDVVLKANEPIKVVKDLMGLDLEYEADILDWVKEFDCGIYLTPEFIEANPDLEITLALKLYNPENPEESYAIGNVYKFTAADAMPQAKIGEGTYKTLAEAIAAANDGDTVTVLKDIAMDEIIVNTKKITLDLNGKTITGTDNTEKNFSLIDNRGELTVTGNGKMTLTSTVNSGWNRYSAVLANNPGGKLVIENGTIEHLGGTDMAYGIDNLTNGKGTYAETVINGGTIKSPYRGIRQFLNGVEAQNILTINGGTVEGANKSIWMQDPSKNANSGKLTVAEGATLNGDVYLSVTEGSTEWPVEVSIAAAALKDGATVVTGNVPDGYEVSESNGVWGVKEVLAETISWNSTLSILSKMGRVSIIGSKDTYGRIRLFAGIDDATKYDSYGFKYKAVRGTEVIEDVIEFTDKPYEKVDYNSNGEWKEFVGGDFGANNTKVFEVALCIQSEWITSDVQVTMTPFVVLNGIEKEGESKTYSATKLFR